MSSVPTIVLPIEVDVGKITHRFAIPSQQLITENTEKLPLVVGVGVRVGSGVGVLVGVLVGVDAGVAVLVGVGVRHKYGQALQSSSPYGRLPSQVIFAGPVVGPPIV